MNWLQFGTIVAQVFIGALVLFILAAVVSVVYNNFKDKK